MNGVRTKLGLARTLITSVGVYALTAALLAGGAAYAQEPAPVDPPVIQAPAPAAPTETDRNEVVVTGTRITQPDFQFSNPIISVGADTIQNAGTTNLTNLLQDIPALVGSSTSNDNAGSNAGIGQTGLNLLNLRNLGTARTLVLVNGRRHVAADPNSTAVDTNTIPIELVDRIDVLTGGASAIYGADGVSGVVNFVTKTDFEGLSLRAQVGAPEKDGAENIFASLTGGQNFMDGKLNIAGSVEYSRDESLSFFQRYNAGQFGRLARNPADVADNPAVPDRLPTFGTRFFDSSRGGAIDVNFDGAPDYNGAGQPWDPGTFVPPFFQVGGSGTLQDEYVGDLLPKSERTATNLFLNYKITPNVRLFSELKFVRVDTSSQSQPSFDFFLTINPDNPFVPANIAADALASESPILVSRDNFDLGVRGEDVRRDTTRAVIGLAGELEGLFDWEVSYVQGETKVRNKIINNRFNDRFFYALDAVAGPGGTITCRSNLDPTAAPNQLFATVPTPGTFTPGANSGCVPLNLFGDGAPSQAATNWVMQSSVANYRVQQKVAQGFISGDLDALFTLPAGSVKYALGGEWRREEASSEPPREDQLGLTFGNVLAPSRGSFEVREAFAEVTVPILKDLPFAYDLTVDAAARYSEYTTVGDTDTWKIGAVWAPIEDVRFRATRARAVRAPNISELFEPGSQTFEFITDPCDIAEQNQGTSTRAANCATLLTALGQNPTTFVDPNSASIPGLQRGNTGLGEEEGDTTTYGVVFQPRFIKGLSMSVDYYDIELTNAINSASAQEIADQCVDLPTTANQFCALLTRSATDGGIASFIIQPVNVASFTTSGYDFSINYTLDPADLGATGDWGLFNFRLIGNKLEELTFVNLPGATPDQDKDEIFAPEWQANLDLTWTKGPFLVNYGFNYFSETDRYTREELANNPDIAPAQFLKYSERATHDVQVRVETPNGVAAYFGVNNVGDQKPDFGQTFYPVPATGRVFYAGVTAKLGAIGDMFR